MAGEPVPVTCTAPEVTIRASVPLSVPLPLNTRLAIVRSAPFNDTTWVLAITAVSSALGIPTGFQMAGSSQFPEAMVVLMLVRVE